MTTATHEATAQDFIQNALEVAVQNIWNAMWKPWNALLNTKYYRIGYIGFLAIALVGFTLSVVHYAYTKVKGYLTK
jgi:preprotein translocase subunit Sss1